MASIRKEISINASPEHVWSAVRAVDEVQRLLPGWISDVKLENEQRVLTLANGTVMKELIVDVDDEAKRLAYAGVGGELLRHHAASMQVVADGAGGAKLLWITDILPNEAAGQIQQMIDQGAQVMKSALEASA